MINLIVMRDPAGNEIPNRCMYLQVVKTSEFAFSDACIKAWKRSGKSLMTEILAFENESGRAKYERDERKTS
jgi:hypothetical protein